MAMPAKVFAVEPPVTWSAVSEKLALNRELTVAPGGFEVFSAIGAKVALPVATGASFTAARVIVTVALAEGRLPSDAVTVKVRAPLSFAAGT